MVKLVEELQQLKAGILTPQQAADILGVKTSTLEKWRVTKRYNLPYLKIGKNVRYRAQDVAAFFEPMGASDASSQAAGRRRSRKAA